MKSKEVLYRERERERGREGGRERERERARKRYFDKLKMKFKEVKP